MIISPAYAQAAAPQGGIDGSFMIMMVGMIIFMYFLVFRPQMKRQKEHKAMMEGLQKGDEVIAAGGMLGRITALADVYMTIEIAPGTEIRVQRASVVTVGYGSGDQALATMGILGPTRMDYAGSMGAVRAVAKYVGQILKDQ